MASRALSGEAGGGQFRLPALQKSISALVSPLPGGRALAVLRDVTEAQRLEGVRRDFIANASHELRTPVTAISGAVETLLGLPPDELGGTPRSFVEMISRHSARLSRLTRDLLDLSRLETGDFALEIGPLELGSLTAACLDYFRKSAQDKKITLGYDGPGQQGRVFERFYRADPGRSREMGGTGLGLAIVKHLAQAQGGQVGVESGQGGSRFWIRLPKAP